jgi:hypothetical protein
MELFDFNIFLGIFLFSFSVHMLFGVFLDKARGYQFKRRYWDLLDTTIKANKTMESSCLLANAS